MRKKTRTERRFFFSGTAGTLLSILLLTSMISSSTVSYTHGQSLSLSTVVDPLGHFEGGATPASISWTGDGNIISNPSFEDTTFAPWDIAEYNAAPASNVVLDSNRAFVYDGTKSAYLFLLSGNLTSISSASLSNDLSQAHAGFSSSTRFRAAVQLQQLTGTTTSDRVELSLNLTSSIGLNKAIHYIIASGSGSSSDTATDAYYNLGPTPVNQWMTIDRNLAQDAAASFPAEYPTFNSVSLVTLTVFGQTRQGTPNHDPRTLYYNPNMTQFPSWQSGLPVVLDANSNGVYDGPDTVLGGCAPPPCAPPPIGAVLADDPLIRYVDSNNNNVWDSGEPIVYDSENLGGGLTISNNGVYDFYDPIIYGNAPTVGTPLVKLLQNHTEAFFDRIELYTATGGSEWIKNGGFESGLTGWMANASFTTTAPPVHSGTQSAEGIITNGAIEMAQSIDGRPLIDSSTRFNVSANIAAMSGTRSMVDIWLGLVDRNYKPVSVYYVFKTGDGNMPANRTDAIYLKPAGFGSLNTWLTVSTSLSAETSTLSQLGYASPYNIEIAVVEVVAPDSSGTATAYFDDISFRTSSHTGTAPATFYATAGLNTTFVYTANNIPQGSLHLEIPRGESILNITSPDGTTLQTNDYSTSILAGCTISPCISNPRAVDVFDSAFFKHSPVGNWRVFATSTNSLSTLYGEDPTSHAQVSSIKVGSTVNFISRSKDPFGTPLVGVPVNITLWNLNTGSMVSSWPGTTDNLGWWNISSITLPLTGTSAGIYVLQASVLSSYPGIRDFQVAVQYAVSIDVSLSSHQTSAGSTVTISGTVMRTDTSGPAPGINITISYRLAGNSQWTVLGTVKTDSSGKYMLTWNPPEGEYQVMAATGDSQTVPAASSPAHLIVSPGDLLQGQWLIVMGIAVVAAVTIIALVFVRRSRMTKPPSNTSPAAL